MTNGLPGGMAILLFAAFAITDHRMLNDAPPNALRVTQSRSRGVLPPERLAALLPDIAVTAGALRFWPVPAVASCIPALQTWGGCGMPSASRLWNPDGGVGDGRLREASAMGSAHREA